MDLTVNIPDEEVPALKAQASGLPLETFVEQVVLERLHASVPPSPTAPRRHIAERICEIMQDVPSEDFASLPKDGLQQIDHYVYGVPKSAP